MNELVFKILVDEAENGESRQYPHVDEAFLWADFEIKQLRQKLEAAEAENERIKHVVKAADNDINGLRESLSYAHNVIREAREQKPYGYVCGDWYFPTKERFDSYAAASLVGSSPIEKVPTVVYTTPVPAMPIQDDKTINWVDASESAPECGRKLFVTDGENIEAAYAYAIHGGAIGDLSGSSLKQVKPIKRWIYQDDFPKNLLSEVKPSC